MTQGPDTGASSGSSGLPSRRRFLTVAAAGTLAGVGGLTGAAAQSQPETIELGGTTAGWVGRSPDRIDGATNPTLHLEAGTDYRITWTNTDGAPHNIEIHDTDGTVLERTAVISGEGKTQTLEFTATEEMATYLCEVHPTTMVGDVSFEPATETTTSGVEVNDSYFEMGPSIRTETVADEGLTAPLDLAMPPGERGRFFVVDQVGQIYVYDTGSGERETFFDLGDQLIDFGSLPNEKVIDERGLLGLAFHPNFAENRKFYVAYSAPRREGTPSNYTHTQVVEEYEANEEGTRALPGTQRPLLEMPSPYYTHNGGALAFGPDDGYLYVSIGNGGGALKSEKQVDDWYAPNRGGNGQDVGHNLLGSILRIDVDTQDGEKAYGIPDDNPLVDDAGLDEHYAWGFRNPWRMGFSGGRLMAADVGQARYEEVDVVEKGGNYGWNVKEGTHCFAATGTPGDTRAACPSRTPDSVRGGEPLIDPVVEYPHPNVEDGPGAGISVIGGYFYENATIPALEGRYVFGDYSKGKAEPTGSLFAATPTDEGQWSTEEITLADTDNGHLNGFLLCVGRDNDGELYALTTDELGPTGETGAVHRLRPPATEGTTAADTETPGQPPTATATAEPTPTATETATATEEPTPTTADTGTTTNASNETEDGGVGRFVPGSGPGFGVLAGLAGLVGIAARLVSRGGDE